MTEPNMELWTCDYCGNDLDHSTYANECPCCGYKLRYVTTYPYDQEKEAT